MQSYLPLNWCSLFLLSFRSDWRNYIILSIAQIQFRNCLFYTKSSPSLFRLLFLFIHQLLSVCRSRRSSFLNFNFVAVVCQSKSTSNRIILMLNCFRSDRRSEVIKVRVRERERERERGGIRRSKGPDPI